MPQTLHVLARRALSAVAVAIVVGAAACGESPTAPGAAPHGASKASFARQHGKSGTAKRGGYNVVAD